MMYLVMINLFDIFRKDRKIIIEAVNVNNPITDHIKENIGKFQVIFSPSRKFIWFKNAKVAGTSMYRGIMKREILDLVSYKNQPTQFDEWWDNLTDRELKKYFKLPLSETHLTESYLRLVILYLREFHVATIGIWS
jgi:hypothetical protein